MEDRCDDTHIYQPNDKMDQFDLKNVKDILYVFIFASTQLQVWLKSHFFLTCRK